MSFMVRTLELKFRRVATINCTLLLGAERRNMKAAGWIVAGILALVVVMNQLTIKKYKEACRSYRKAIAVYEGR
jgi:predicted nucleic acid-binding Zn ribbon protein